MQTVLTTAMQLATIIMRFLTHMQLQTYSVTEKNKRIITTHYKRLNSTYSVPLLLIYKTME